MKMREMKSMGNSGKNKNRLVAVMAFVIVIMAAVLVYSFALEPTFNGYVVSKQIEAQDIVLSSLISQIQQNGYVQIPVGEEVLTLVPYQEPTGQPAEQEVVQ